MDVLQRRQHGEAVHTQTFEGSRQAYLIEACTALESAVADVLDTRTEVHALQLRAVQESDLTRTDHVITADGGRNSDRSGSSRVDSRLVDVLNRRDAGVRIHGDLLLLVAIDLYQLVVGFDQTVSNGHTLFGVLGEEDVFHQDQGNKRR